MFTLMSGKKMASVGFLLAVLLITLTLGSITFLINDNDTTLPDIGLNAGLEGNCNRKEGLTNDENRKMELNVKKMRENTKNAPDHSKTQVTK